MTWQSLMLRHFPCLMEQWMSFLFTFGSQSPEVFALKITDWPLGERFREAFWNMSGSKIAPWRSVNYYQGSELWWQGKNYASTNIHVFCNYVIWNCSNSSTLKCVKTHVRNMFDFNLTITLSMVNFDFLAIFLQRR